MYNRFPRMIGFYIGFALFLGLVWGCWSNLTFLNASKQYDSNLSLQKPDFLDNPPEGLTIHPTPIKRYKQVFYICKTKYFKIHFVEKDKDLAFNSAKEIDSVYERLADWYQHQLLTPYEVYFLPDKNTIYRVTGETRSLGGVVTQRRGTMFIASQYYNIQTIAHELSHLFLRKKLRERKVPIWFNEGLAEYLSTPNVNSDYVKNFIFEKLQNSDRLYTWREMERNIMLRNSSLTYTEVLSIILFLNQRYGEDKLGDLLNLYSERDYHRSFIGAMSQVYGKSQRDLEQEWLDFIKEYHN